MAPKDGLEHPTTGEDTIESFAEDDVAISNYDESEEFVTGCCQTLSFVACRLFSEEILNFFNSSPALEAS